MNEEEKDIEYLQKYINWETAGERSLEKSIETVLRLYKDEKEENRKKNIVISEYQDLLEREKEKNKKLEEVIKLMASDMERIGTTDELIGYYFKKARGEEDG